MKKAKKEDEIFGEVIFSYTRAQAIEDGTLIDVTEVAKKIGFKYSIAITQGVEELLTPSEFLETQGENYSKRLHHLLCAARYTIRAGGLDKQCTNGHDDPTKTSFKVLLVSHHTHKPEEEKLEAICHPGDNLEPVITIQRPGED